MIDIAYFGDASYAGAIRVSVFSALRRMENAGSFRVHIVSCPDDGASVSIETIVFEPFSRKNRNFKLPRALNSFDGWHGTHLVWLRIFFPEIFPDLDWIISCDGDTLWFDSPENLWSLRRDDLLLLASRDVPAADGHPFPYHAWWAKEGLEMDVSKCYCMGLSLLNLKKMRAEGFSAACLDFTAAHPAPPVREQTVMCYLARNASAPLPAGWGVFSFWHTTMPHVNVVHYVQDLPWHRHKPNRLMSDIVMAWWREKSKIPADFLPFYNFSHTSKAGYKGCRNKLDYAWRRLAYLAMKPLAPLIDRIPFLRPRFRNARGFSANRTIKAAPSRDESQIIAR